MRRQILGIGFVAALVLGSAPALGQAASTFNYCVATPNSTGHACTINAFGSVSVSENNFALLARGTLPHSKGLFLYGQNPAQYPFGDGYLCIDPFNPGVLALRPWVQASAAGFAGNQVQFASLLPPGVITPGSTWHFQYIYRDAGTQRFNSSNGLGATFAP